MSARRLNSGIRSGTKRSKGLREAARRVARGDRAPQEPSVSRRDSRDDRFQAVRTVN